MLGGGNRALLDTSQMHTCIQQYDTRCHTNVHTLCCSARFAPSRGCWTMRATACHVLGGGNRVLVDTSYMYIYIRLCHTRCHSHVYASCCSARFASSRGCWTVRATARLVLGGGNRVLVDISYMYIYIRLCHTRCVSDVYASCCSVQVRCRLRRLIAGVRPGQNPHPTGRHMNLQYSH